ncbi:hypothetical protein [Niallia sp. FSL W8-0954]|uniref:hypothetical protein n=1 Tax=Niallia sp. FSL W8-0954 TaxID=2975338 RepID=UPI0030FCADD2
MNNTCFVLNRNEWIEAEYIGVYQYSNVVTPSPMIGGHPGGVIAHPVVVVKMNNRLKEFSIYSVKFPKDE